MTYPRSSVTSLLNKFLGVISGLSQKGIVTTANYLPFIEIRKIILSMDNTKSTKL